MKTYMQYIKENNDDEEMYIIDAIYDNNIDFIKDVVYEYGVDYIWDEYYTILHCVVQNEKISYDIIKFLLDNGANINIQDDDEKITPLMNVCYNERVDLVELLLKYNPDINITDYEGKNALFYVCNKRRGDENKRIEIAKLLLNNGIDINHTDTTTDYAVLLAFFHKQFKLFKMLVINGADITPHGYDDDSDIFYYHKQYWNDIDNQEFIFRNAPYAIKKMMKDIKVYPELVEKYKDVIESLDDSEELGLL